MTHEGRRTSALLSIATLTVMATMAIAPALPAMAAHFSATPNAELLVKLALTMPAIAIALFAPLAGWFIDRFGRLKMLYSSMALFGAAGMSGYFLEDLYAILVSRFVLGIAIGGSMTTMYALAGDYLRPETRSRFAGMQSVVMSFGAMLLVGLAGWLADYSWRGPFLLYAYGWLLIPFVARVLEEPRRVAAQSGGPAVEKLRRGELITLYVLAWFSAVMFYMVASQLPFLLRDRGVSSGVLVGLAVGLVQLFAATGSALHGRVKRDRGFLAVYAIAFVLMGLGYGLISSVSSYAVVLAGAMVTGIGVGLFFPNSTLWVLTLAPAHLRGRCSGGLSASLNFGQFASPVVLQPAVAMVGLGGAFGVSAGLLFAVAVFLTVTPSLSRAR